MAAARALCERKGLKLTDIRAAVVQALAEAPQPMGAYDLIDALAGQGFRRLAPISVYRALDFLMQAGLVHKLQSRNAFVACPHQHGADDVVVFMICEDCNRVEEAVSPVVTEGLAALAHHRGFQPKAQVIELAGRCRQCQAPAAQPATAFA
jgi:Fur family zinc uptake transcriptional regulator